MIVRTYLNAEEFLSRTQQALLKDEAANSLMLGVCLQLARHPERIEHQPYLATVHDEHGLAIAAVMTPPRNLILFGDGENVPDASEIIVRDLLSHAWNVPGVLGPSAVAVSFAEAWEKLSRKEYQGKMHQLVYQLNEVKHLPSTPGTPRVAEPADVEFLTRWILGFKSEVFGSADPVEVWKLVEHKIAEGDMYVWEDGQPVSTAAKTRPTLNGISIGMVYTPPKFRRQGYATACVASLSQTLLQSGWAFCTLFADVKNPASNRIYEKVGYTPVCDYAQIDLDVHD